MDPVAAPASSAAAEPPQTHEPAASLTGHALGWFSSAKSRAGVVTDLALAEAKLAAMSVALMIFLATMAAVCVIGAWGLTLAGIAYLLIAVGIPLWATLLILIAALAAAAALLWRAAAKASRHLDFAATREQLGKADAAPGSKSSPQDAAA